MSDCRITACANPHALDKREKTCGTCQRLETHRAPLYGRFLCYYNVSIASNGAEIPNPRSEDDAACESWIERTDSLEAVALDAVRKLERAAALIDVERWERIVYSQVDDLRARLKALRVER